MLTSNLLWVIKSKKFSFAYIFNKSLFLQTLLHLQNRLTYIKSTYSDTANRLVKSI